VGPGLKLMSFTDGLGELSDPTRAGWVFAFIFSFQIVFMGKIGPLFSPGKYGHLTIALVLVIWGMLFSPSILMHRYILQLRSSDHDYGPIFTI
jgi:hypothetical protein